MIKHYDSSIEAILPVNLNREPEIQAISYAIQQQIRKLSERMRSARVYAAVDEMEDEALDLLALELGSQYYEESLGIQEKREIVKNTLNWYMKSGTVSAVRELIETVFGEGGVVEWFDFPDDEKIPGTFDVETGGTLDEDAMEEISVKIKNIKNARSHLRKIRAIRHAVNNVKIGGKIFSDVKIEIYARRGSNAGNI